MMDENELGKAGRLSPDAKEDTEEVPPPAAPKDSVPWTWLSELKDNPLTTEPPPRKWLLRRAKEGERGEEGVLPLGKAGMLAAAGGAGKTMALVQLALSVATGKHWLNKFMVPKEGRGHVLLALAEEDAEEVWRRLFKCARAIELTTDESRLALERIAILPLAGVPVAFVRSDKAGNVSETEEFVVLRKRIQDAQKEWRLIVLDPLSRFAGPDTEKDNSAATRFVQCVETLLTVPGNPTVLVAHHTSQQSRKDNDESTTGARGVTGLTDGFRWVATINPKEGRSEYATITAPTKSNYSRIGTRILLRRDQKNSGALRALDSAEQTILEAQWETEKMVANAAKKAARAGNGAAEPPETPGLTPSMLSRL